jgi:cell pole-organizing protein PopZ
MSKPDSAGAKSLEEILASIRKSLADEPGERASAAPKPAPAKAALPEPKPAASANAPAKSPGFLLAGKLNQNAQSTQSVSSKANGTPHGSASSARDDDLSELLATQPTRPVAPAPAETPKAPQSNGDAKDPLWFLSRLSAASGGNNTVQGSAARARDAAKAATPPAEEEVKLSRPETLRPSLPPLFGASTTSSAKAEPTISASATEKAADVVSLTARTYPRSFSKPADEEVEQEKARAEPEAAPAAPALKVGAKGTESASTAREELPLASLPANPTPSLQVAAPMSSASATRPAMASLADVLIDPEPVSNASVGTPSADLVPTGGGLPSQPLEQAIGALLEPAIRQWLQTNLPRLIEKAVREEVARVMAADGTTKM